MDFWAQHKDFILRILAGIGVFLVALIARSITYGDDLKKEMDRNAALAREIRKTEVAPMAKIQEVEADAAKLRANAKAITTQIGWDLADEGLLQGKLIERILRTTRRYAHEGEADVKRAAEDFRNALREDLNGGFGQLRLMVRQELVEEAGEKNIKVETGIGFGNVTEMDSDELMQYLLQLELVARVARYAIDAGVDEIESVGITPGGPRREPVIPGANPDFLQEYEVKVGFKASQQAARAILDRLETEEPRVALTGMRLARLSRPADHISVEIELQATAANPDVQFAGKEKP